MMLVEGQSPDSIKLNPLVNLHKPWHMRKVVVSAHPANSRGQLEGQSDPSNKCHHGLSHTEVNESSSRANVKTEFRSKEFAGYSKLLRTCIGTIWSGMMLIHSIATDPSRMA